MMTNSSIKLVKKVLVSCFLGFVKPTRKIVVEWEKVLVDINE